MEDNIIEADMAGKEAMKIVESDQKKDDPSQSVVEKKKKKKQLHLKF